MKFDKKSGKWIDAGGPRGMGSKQFRERHETVADESDRRWQKLENKRVREGLTKAEADQHASLAQYSRWMMQAALQPTKTREEAEEVGLKNVNGNRQDAVADRRDEIRSVHRPGMSAEEIRRAVTRRHGSEHKLRTIQRDLREMGLTKN
ncbi:MAG: hypothetical protein JXR14_05320 [Paracoccaceae bacterium]